MKSVIILMILALILVSCSEKTTAPIYDFTSPLALQPTTGDGTETNPYRIENLGNLYWLSQDEDKWDSSFIQTANIDASYTQDWFDGQGWKAIGYFTDENDNKPFTGRYDGSSFTINGLFINRPDSNYQGLFGRTEGATITNIGITNADITGRNRVGALVGNNRSGSIIANSYSTGKVNGYWCAGGLVGGNWTATISNSYSTADVSADSHTVGGLVGYNGDAIISNSYSTGFVAGIDGNEGGMIGVNVNSEINNSYWNKETSGQDISAGGEKRDTEEMIYPYSSNTYVNWDFNSIWTEDTGRINNGYPYLK